MDFVTLERIPETIRAKVESIAEVEHPRHLTDAALDCAN